MYKSSRRTKGSKQIKRASRMMGSRRLWRNKMLGTASRYEISADMLSEIIREILGPTKRARSGIKSARMIAASVKESRPAVIGSGSESSVTTSKGFKIAVGKGKKCIHENLDQIVSSSYAL